MKLYKVLKEERENDEQCEEQSETSLGVEELDLKAFPMDNKATFPTISGQQVVDTTFIDDLLSAVLNIAKIQKLPETEPIEQVAQPIEEIFESEFTMEAVCNETNVMPEGAVPLQVEYSRSPEPIIDNDSDAFALAALIAAR